MTSERISVFLIVFIKQSFYIISKNVPEEKECGKGTISKNLKPYVFSEIQFCERTFWENNK